MPSTASALLKVELQAAGENSNTWGTKANDVFSRLEDGMAGRTVIALTANVTLTDTQYVANEARAIFLDITSGAGGFSITIPNRAKVYLVRNGSSGTATITTGAGTTVAIASGDVEWVASTGANVVYRVQLPTAALAADAVTYAKMQNVSATDKLLGRSTAGAGDVEEIACTAAGRALIDDADAGAQRTTLGLGTIAVLAEGTTAEYRANTAARALSTDKVWAAAVPVALTDAATVAVDMSLAFNFTLAIAGNRTLGNPTNTKDGQSGFIKITQDVTGSRTLAYAANWLFNGGTDPVLSTVAGTKDVLYYQVLSATEIHGSLNKALA